LVGENAAGQSRHCSEPFPVPSHPAWYFPVTFVQFTRHGVLEYWLWKPIAVPPEHREAGFNAQPVGIFEDGEIMQFYRIN